MSVSLHHTQRIRGFQQQSVKYSGRTMLIALKRTKFNCPWCGSENVALQKISDRKTQGEPLGYYRKFILKLTTHRLYCRDCPARAMEHTSSNNSDFEFFTSYYLQTLTTRCIIYL